MMYADPSGLYTILPSNLSTSEESGGESRCEVRSTASGAAGGEVGAGAEEGAGVGAAGAAGALRGSSSGLMSPSSSSGSSAAELCGSSRLRRRLRSGGGPLAGPPGCSGVGMAPGVKGRHHMLSCNKLHHT